jgi:hypothetical protein
MGSVNASSSNNPNMPLNPYNLQAVENIAGTALEQVSEQGESLSQKAIDFFLTMQFMDAESSERLTMPEKGGAVGLGLVSFLAFTQIAHRLAGLDANLGTLTPESKATAKNSLMGKLARAVDKFGPQEGRFKNLPTWLRIYIGDLPTNEYMDHWLLNHEHAVNATASKLSKHLTTPPQPKWLSRFSPPKPENPNAFTKGAELPEGSLLQRYIAQYTDVHQRLEQAHTGRNYFTPFQDILSGEQQKKLTLSLLHPLMEADPRGNLVLEKDTPFYAHFKALYEEALAQAQQSTSHDALWPFRRPNSGVGHPLLGWFRQKGPDPLTFEQFIKECPSHSLNHEMKQILELVPHESKHFQALQEAVLDDVHKINPLSVKRAVLEAVHHNLYRRSQMIDLAQARFVPKHAQQTDVKVDVKTLRDSILSVQRIGDNDHWIPFSRFFSKLFTSDAELEKLRTKAIVEIESNRTHWEQLLGPEVVQKHLDALDLKNPMSKGEFFKRNLEFGKYARAHLESFQKIHEVLPRSIKRLVQNIAEHEQFIHNQKELSEAWGVSGLGRSVASLWRGMIDLVKFGLHETPEEVLKNKALAMANLKSGVTHPLSNMLQSIKDPRYLAFFLGAMGAFSAGWAAFMAAGKPTKAKALQGSQAKAPVPATAQAKASQASTPAVRSGTAVFQAQPTAQPTTQASKTPVAVAKSSPAKEDRFVLGEQLKAGVRSFLGIALPMIGAHQLIMFINRGNPLGKILGGHYLTSFKFPFGVAGFHWLTAAGTAITFGNVLFLSNFLRQRAEKAQDKSVGKPTYLVEYEEREKAVSALEAIKNRQFSDLKKEDIALIAKYPEASKKAKIQLTPAQIEEAFRLAGQKPVREIDPKEAALLYALAQSAKNPTATDSTGFGKTLTAQEAALLYTLAQQGSASTGPAVGGTKPLTAQEAALFYTLAQPPQSTPKSI